MKNIKTIKVEAGSNVKLNASSSAVEASELIDKKIFKNNDYNISYKKKLPYYIKIWSLACLIDTKINY